MSPIPQANGHDAPRLVCEPVPSFTAVIEEVAVGGEDPVGEPVLAHELPDVLDRVQLRGFGGQRHERDVVGDHQPLGLMPSRLIEQHHRMRTRRDSLRDLRQMQAHALTRAARQDEASPFPFSRADRAENVSRLGSLVLWGRGASAASGPAPSDLVLLPDPCLVAEPDLYRLATSRTCLDLLQTGREGFLKAVTSTSFLA